MKFDLSFWRLVIVLSFAKSWLWKKDDDTYYLHIGSFTNGRHTALKLVVLPLSLCVGFV